MIKNFLRHSKWVLLLCVQVTMLHSISFAQKAQNTVSSETKGTIAPWKQRTNDYKKELMSLRNRTNKHFEKANGEVRMISSVGSLHYQKGNQWLDIHTDIVSNTTGIHIGNPYANTENQFQTYFPTHPVNGKTYTQLPDGEMSEQVDAFYATDNNGNMVYQFNANTTATVITNDASVSYTNVFPNTEIRYTNGADARKFDMILQNNQIVNSLPASAKYLVIKEKMVLPSNWTVSQTNNGIDMYNGTTWVANLPKPIAYDQSASASKLEGTMTFTQNGNEIVLYTTFKTDWLKETNRVFPIHLDPLVNYYPINTAMWTGRMTTATGAKASGNLRLATAGAISWAQFNISTLPPSAIMVSAKYWGYHYSSAAGTGDKLSAVVGMQTVEPVSAINTAINAQITAATSPIYNGGYVFGNATTNQWRSATLGGTALADILAQVGQGWTAFGFKFASGNGAAMLQNGIEIFVSNPALLPYLELDYSTSACSGQPVGGQATSTVLNACGDPFTLNLTGNTSGAGMEFQWLQSPAGLNTWTLLGSQQTSPVYVHTQSSPTDYRCIAICTGSSLFDTSLVVSVGQTPVAQCYSIPTGALTSTNYITSFSTSGAGSNIINAGTGYSATPTPGYGDYTNFVISAVPGAVIVDTIKFVSGSHTIGIWIDWNQDGDFNDAGETIVTTGSTTSSSPFVSSFTVPALGPNVLSGNTRLRIRTSASGQSLPSGLNSFGEAEDYTFNVLGPCTVASTSSITPSTYSICPNTAQTLTATVPIFQTGITYQWKSSPTAGGPYTNIAGATSLSYNTGSLAPGTYYYIFETACSSCTPCAVLSNEVTINVSDVPAPTATNSAQCAPGIPTASVSSNAGSLSTGNFNWYSAPTGGTLLQARPFGPVQPYYFNDFSSATLVNSSILNDAAISGGLLTLHPATTTKNGSLTVNASGFNSDKYQIDFDVTTAGPLGSTGEGFSYSFADNANAAVESMNAENGTGSRLKIGFVAATNLSSTQGIYLMYNCSTNEQTPVTAGVLGYSTDVSWVNATKHVTINIDSLGRLTLLLDATPIFTNVVLGAAYLSANKSTWKHVFKSRTTASVMSVALDNVDIKQSTLTSGSPNYLSSIPATTTFYVSEIGANGCFSPRVPVVATVNTPATIIATAIPNDSVCTGTPVTLSASGGVSYIWNGNSTTVNGDTTFAQAAAGIFTVTGTDANSCTRTATISIYLHPVISGTASASPANICAGSTTTITAVPTPICTGLSINKFLDYFDPTTWTFANTTTNGTFNFSASPDTIKLTTGTSGPFTGGRTTLSKTITCSGTLSFGWRFSYLSDAYLDYPQYSINGGTPIDFPTYNYNGTFAGTQTGTVSIAVNDGDIFAFHAATEDNDADAATLSIYNFVAPSPKINATVAFWDAASGGTNLGANPLSVSPATTTTYYAEYTVTNNTGCVNPVREPVTVNVNPAPTATVSGGGTVCAGATLPDVQIALTGIAPWTFTYTDGSTSTPITTSTNPYMITNASAGVYTVTNILDASCAGTFTGSATVTVNPIPTATVSGGGTVCVGNPLPEVSIALSGTPPWNISFTDGTTTSAITTSSNPYTFTPTTTGTYSVTVLSDANCTGTFSGVANVVTYALPAVTATASVLNTCTETVVTLTGGGANSYVWSDGRSDASPFVIQNTTTFTVTGTDANTCSATSTVTVTVNPASTILSNANSGNANSIAGNNSGSDNQLANSNIAYYSGSCNLIARIVSTLALGATTSEVTVDGSIVPHNGQPFVPRWFQIIPTNNVGATVTFYLTQDDFNDYNTYATANGWPLLPTGPTDVAGILNLRITKNDNTGLGNNPIVLTPNTVIWNATNSYWEIEVAVPGFSQFRFHSANPLNAPLAVNITEFTGQIEGSTDVLSWVTAKEENHAYFNLQHSADGIHFTTIQKVASKALNGNSFTNLNYTVSNANPLSGLNYYRLEHVDIDGKSGIHSKIVQLKRFVNNDKITVYPNPTKEVLHVDVSQSTNTKATLRVLDIAGRTVKVIETALQKGNSTIDIQLNNIANGHYTLQWMEGNTLKGVIKFVVEK